MILVTGAKGVVGTPLCERLALDGQAYVSVSRKPCEDTNQLTWNLHDAPSADAVDALNGINCLIHCAPIWLLPQHLETLSTAGVKRLIVFSSTSVISKRDSQESSEQLLVSQLADAEMALNRFCHANNINLTIFRPSLIYGYGRDQNVSRIASFIRRFGFMLLVGQGAGKRQPVHADDLVDAVINVINAPQTYAKTYNLVGAETLTYREMVTRIFVALGKKPRVLSLPLWVFRMSLKFAAKITSFSYTAEMADRMNQDLAYDSASAETDFQYAPQAFLDQPERDLKA